MKILRKILVINCVCLFIITQSVVVFAGWEIDIFTKTDNAFLEEEIYVDHSNRTNIATTYRKSIQRTYTTTTTTSNSVKLSGTKSGLGAEINDVYSWNETSSTTYEDVLEKSVSAKYRWIVKGQVFGKYASGWAEYYKLGIFLTDYTGWTISTPKYVRTTESFEKLK